MLKDITLGQFFPGNSLLHRLDPRTKILCSILLIVAVFLAKSALAYGVLILLTAALIIISQIPAGTVFKALKPLIVIIIITAFFNMFFTGGEEENVLADFRIWFLHPVIRVEGIVSAVKMALRIVLLILQTSVVLTYTTSPIDMTDGIERLLSPLAKIRVPVHTFAMMMSLALRFIPLTVDEFGRISAAQAARGARLGKQGAIATVKRLRSVVVPLTVRLFSYADDVANAMARRGYDGTLRDTGARPLRIGGWLTLAAGLAAAIVAVII